MSMRSIYTNRDKRIRDEGLAASYKDYLMTDLWKSIRERVLKRDGGTCRICGDIATQVHHTCYTRSVLTGRCLIGAFAICRPCHKFIEFNQDGTKGHLWKDVRGRVKLLARIKGRVFLAPCREKRPCPRCKRATVLQNLNDDGVCNRCLKGEVNA